MEFIWLERVEDAVASALEATTSADTPASVPQLAGADA
jgi:hypothetical protein